jgi:hypothetical protein
MADHMYRQPFGKREIALAEAKVLSSRRTIDRAGRLLAQVLAKGDRRPTTSQVPDDPGRA